MIRRDYESGECAYQCRDEGDRSVFAHDQYSELGYGVHLDKDGQSGDAEADIEMTDDDGKPWMRVCRSASVRDI